MRYRSLSSYFRERFKAKVGKVPLDAGFSCPNRDGTLSRGGCVFCNAAGSGPGLYAKGLSLREQWDAWRARPTRKRSPDILLAYLQAFSNTHGPAERVRRVIDEIAALPDAAGLCLGTRPDCLDKEKLDIIAAAPLGEIRLELGLQSSCDDTLRRINRGHTAADFAHTAEAAHARGLKVVAHVIAGLPGEGRDAFLETIRFLNALPVHAVKLHNLYVAENTALARLYRQGGYTPIKRRDYIDWTCDALALLRPDMVVERLNGDPKPGELVAPAWAADKSPLLRDIRRALEDKDIRQGKDMPPAA